MSSQAGGSDSRGKGKGKGKGKDRDAETFNGKRMRSEVSRTARVSRRVPKVCGPRDRRHSNLKKHVVAVRRH